MSELSRHSTFVVGLRVDEDGDLRFALGDNVIEIRLNAHDEPIALRRVGIAELDEAGFPWEASKPD